MNKDVQNTVNKKLCKDTTFCEIEQFSAPSNLPEKSGKFDSGVQPKR